MEWTDLIVFYGSAAAVYVDELTKTDLMILLGAYLLGDYFGSKRHAVSRQTDV